MVFYIYDILLVLIFRLLYDKMFNPNKKEKNFKKKFSKKCFLSVYSKEYSADILLTH